MNKTAMNDSVRMAEAISLKRRTKLLYYFTYAEVVELVDTHV
ncbi:MAG: hypothetical protein M0Z79_11905 [Nitrospiraceae bacterium]|nr:hypothetical protein [Nitrospiraceae bacterium]